MSALNAWTRFMVSHGRRYLTQRTLTNIQHERTTWRCFSAEKQSVNVNNQPPESAALNTEIPVESKPTFAGMLRRSAFIQVGEHKDVKLIGKIIQVQDDNIYVDFGGKFYCVCNLEVYTDDLDKRAQFVRGKDVVISLQSFEASARFMGATVDTTLLEANASLVGLYSPKKREPNDTSDDFEAHFDLLEDFEVHAENSDFEMDWKLK